MPGFTPALYRYGKIAACFAIAGVISGLHVYVSLFGVGFVFGCAAFYCLRVIEDNEDERILVLPLVTGVIYLLAMFIPPLFSKIAAEIQWIDELSRKLHGENYNLFYIECALIGSVLLAGYLHYLGGHMFYVIAVALSGTLLSIFFFNYVRADSTLFDKFYPFIIWQITIGVLSVQALRRHKTQIQV
ncbi:MAG TPA: hypothetical protein VK154_04605 [Chitinophagales bacterium]|nr:hypothetical protein [Chitinophagales bacterium]